MSSTIFKAYEVVDDSGEHLLQTYEELENEDDYAIAGVVLLKYSEETAYRGSGIDSRVDVGDVVSVNGCIYAWCEVIEIIE